MLLEAIEVIEGNQAPAGILASATGPVSNGHHEYRHVWPRDAVLTALELMHYRPQAAFDALAAVCKLPTIPTGLLYQRYEADGRPDDLAWTNSDGTHQIDQDALKLVGASFLPANRLGHAAREKLYSDYLSLVEYASSRKTSTDVWEQKQGYFFYTSAALLWGLGAAAKMFAGRLAPSHAALEGALRSSILSLYNPALGCFVKSPSELVIDLEVVLGLVTLYESGVFSGSREFVERTLNTLSVFERDLMQPVGSAFAPIRYKGDFWDGERVGPAGIGRPWPMGTALLSSAYSLVCIEAAELGMGSVANYCFTQSTQWLLALSKLPYAKRFAEQVDSDGHVPRQGPVGLSWAAAEYLRARRLAYSAQALCGEGQVIC